MQVTIFRHRFAALALTLCAGCSVGPRYQPPQVSLQPWQHPMPAEGAREIDWQHWWHGFGDPALSSAVDRALKQNLDLEAAGARLQQARAVALEAGAARLTSGELQISGASERQSLNGPIGTIARDLPGYRRDQTQRDVAAGAGWELDLFGQLRANARAAREDAESAAALQAAVRVAVSADAADAYLQVRSAELRLQVAQSQIDADARLRELVRLRLRHGAATERELAQAEALLSQARATVPPLRLNRARQLNRLDVLMGVQPGAEAAHLLTGGPDLPPQVPRLTTLEGDAFLRRRPDVRAAERRLAAASDRIGVAVAEYYPKVSVAGLLGFESLQGGFLFTSQSFQPQALAGLRWRLFDFGRVDAEIRQADAVRAVRLAELRLTVLQAAEEVENALESLLQLNAQSAELEHEIAALTQARDAAQAAYLGGAIDLLDVLDAERQLLTAKDQWVVTQVGAARAAVAAYRAMGGGW